MLFLSSANGVKTGPTCNFLYVLQMLYRFWLYSLFFNASNWFDILASESGSGTLLIQLGVLTLAEQCHTQVF